MEDDSMNALKTGFLLAIMTSFFILIGKFIGGSGGMWIAFVFAIIMNVGSYWMSDKIVLKVFKAKKVDESDHKSLLDIFNNLCKNRSTPGKLTKFS